MYQTYVSQVCKIENPDVGLQKTIINLDIYCKNNVEYGGLHGREFLGRTLMILILKILPLVQPSLF